MRHSSVPRAYADKVAAYLHSHEGVENLTLVGVLMSELTALHLPGSRSIENAMQRAIDSHRGGRLSEAEAIYIDVLRAMPRHPDANHNLGVVFARTKRAAQGLGYFVAALETDPTSPQYWLSYIDALMLADRLSEARQVLTHARSQGLQGKEADALAARLLPTAVGSCAL
jgi:predicted Zn-dependent protease